MTTLPIAMFAGFILLAGSWLVPNHYWPWLAFHSDALAALGMATLVVTAITRRRSPLVWPPIALIALALAFVPPVQAATGLIFFWGDAWVPMLYLLGFAFSVVTGRAFVVSDRRTHVLRLYWLCIVLASLISAGIAIYQLLGLPPVGVLMAELPPNMRPFGNVAQPNQLATILVVGVVGAVALHQSGAISRPTLATAVGLLLLATAATRSRAAWIEVALLVLWLLVSRSAAGFRTSRRFALAGGVWFALLVWNWQSLCDLLNLPVVRTAAEQAEAGTRPTHWASMLDAVSREPWWGYGWNQVSVAQVRVAADHPFTGEMIEHSHNIVLDLLIWSGAPLGFAIIVACACWFWKRARLCRDADAVCLLAAIGVICIHGLLEFPLEYAYLLLPLGFMVGGVEGTRKITSTFITPRWGATLLAAATMALAVTVAKEYVKLEEDGRRLRFEVANIGPSALEGDSEKILVLTQLRELYLFMRTPARRDTSPAQLSWMQAVTQRYPYSSALFRYAMAAALNGQPKAAKDAISVLCKIHTKTRCDEGRKAWFALAEDQYPELKMINWPATGVLLSP